VRGLRVRVIAMICYNGVVVVTGKGLVLQVGRWSTIRRLRCTGMLGVW